MSTSVSPDGDGDEAREPTQPAWQVWLVCLLFVLVPAILILAVKYFLAA